MDFINIAKKRHSVRSYTNQKVEPEKLEQILEAAHVAPTAANLQPVHLLVVQSEEGLAKISKAAGIYGAPMAIIVCADHNKAWTRPFTSSPLPWQEKSVSSSSLLWLPTPITVPYAAG